MNVRIPATATAILLALAAPGLCRDLHNPL